MAREERFSIVDSEIVWSPEGLDMLLTSAVVSETEEIIQEIPDQVGPVITKEIGFCEHHVNFLRHTANELRKLGENLTATGIAYTYAPQTLLRLNDILGGMMQMHTMKVEGGAVRGGDIGLEFSGNEYLGLDFNKLKFEVMNVVYDNGRKPKNAPKEFGSKMSFRSHAKKAKSVIFELGVRDAGIKDPEKDNRIGMMRVIVPIEEKPKKGKTTNLEEISGFIVNDGNGNRKLITSPIMYANGDTSQENFEEGKSF